MRPQTLIRGLYGELRGYRRLRIRRQVMAHEHLSFDELRELNAQLFRQRVNDAITQFPFYAEHVRKHRGSLPAPNEPILSDELPIWTRADQRAFYDQQGGAPPNSHFHRTSGTVGSKVFFYVTRESFEWRLAIADRSYMMADAEQGRRSFYIWQADHGESSRWHRFKRVTDSLLQRRWFFDAFQRFGDEQMYECCRAIDRTRPEAIIGYTGMLVDLARFVRDNPDTLRWKAARAVTAAEGLEPGQRGLIEAHLADELYDSYGSREFMNIGMECERHDGYHLTTDNLTVEVVGEDGRSVAPGERGRIVVTDLRNTATPFIRYEIGDSGVMAPPEPCPCGRPFPLMASLSGRIADVIQTTDGRQLTALYVTFALRDCFWVEGHQVVQESPDRLLVRLLATEDPTPERTAVVTKKLREMLGESMKIDYERVDTLSRSASGKVLPVMSSVKND